MEEKQQTNETQTGKGRKKKRVSKKSKRSWRKHTDIRDIEEHLDEVRRQERLGGVISLKEDEQLFFVDTETTENDQGDERKNEFPKHCGKVYLEPYTKPILGRKRKIKKFESKKEADSSSDGSTSEEEEIKPLMNKKPNKQQTQTKYDLWDSCDIKSTHNQPKIDPHYLRATKKHPVKQPKTAYKVRAKVPAVAVCHPGASYNPTLEDHQSLLMAACQIEIIKEKEIQKIQRQLQLPPDEELAKLPSWEEEMSQGLFNDEFKESGEEEQSSDEETEMNDILPYSKTASRKTLKEKKKEIERKKEEKKAFELRKEKVKENDVFRVKTMKKQIREADERTKQRQTKKSEKEKKDSLKPQRLGKHKFEEKNIEIQLTDELAGSLRRLKPEGNLFEDRYKSLQRRNIIEPRKLIAPHRKFALKEYQKRSFKNYDLQEKLKEKRKRRS